MYLPFADDDDGVIFRYTYSYILRFHCNQFIFPTMGPLIRGMKITLKRRHRITCVLVKRFLPSALWIKTCLFFAALIYNTWIHVIYTYTYGCNVLIVHCRRMCTEWNKQKRLLYAGYFVCKHTTIFINTQVFTIKKFINFSNF